MEIIEIGDIVRIKDFIVKEHSEIVEDIGEEIMPTLLAIQEYDLVGKIIKREDVDLFEVDFLLLNQNVPYINTLYSIESLELYKHEMFKIEVDNPRCRIKIKSITPPKSK